MLPKTILVVDDEVANLQKQQSLIGRYRVNNYIAVASLSLDLREGSGFLANGGMPFPYMIRQGEVEQIGVAGLPLGLMEEGEYEQTPLHLAPGDTLVLASDGATDATNRSGEMYDAKRLEESMRSHFSLPTAAFAHSLFEDITRFAGDTELRDDVTILAIRRLR